MKHLIEEWQTKKNGRKKAHKKLVANLRVHKTKHFDRLAGELHDQAFSQIDCLQCANCCTSIPPIVNKTDAARIAKHLGMKTPEFEEKYLTRDEDGDTVINSSPCPFLEENNACSIYEHRPRACREYPHTDARQFSQNLDLHVQNARYCPAVFHILQKMESAIP